MVSLKETAWHNRHAVKISAASVGTRSVSTLSPLALPMTYTCSKELSAAEPGVFVETADVYASRRSKYLDSPRRFVNSDSKFTPLRYAFCHYIECLILHVCGTLTRAFSNKFATERRSGKSERECARNVFWRRPIESSFSTQRGFPHRRADVYTGERV